MSLLGLALSLFDQAFSLLSIIYSDAQKIEFTNVWETAYNVVDQTFNCELNRTGSADNKMVRVIFVSIWLSLRSLN